LVDHTFQDDDKRNYLHNKFTVMEKRTRKERERERERETEREKERERQRESKRA